MQIIRQATNTAANSPQTNKLLDLHFSIWFNTIFIVVLCLTLIHLDFGTSTFSAAWIMLLNSVEAENHIHSKTYEKKSLVYFNGNNFLHKVGFFHFIANIYNIHAHKIENASQIQRCRWMSAQVAWVEFVIRSSD